MKGSDVDAADAKWVEDLLTKFESERMSQDVRDELAAEERRSLAAERLDRAAYTHRLEAHLKRVDKHNDYTDRCLTVISYSAGVGASSLFLGLLWWML